MPHYEKNKELIQNDLGKRLGVTFHAVRKWERGETILGTDNIIIDTMHHL